MVEGVRFPVAGVELGVDTRPGGLVGEWWKALSNACAAGCEILIEVGVGLALDWTGVLDEESVGGLMGANPEVGGLIGAKPEVWDGGGGGRTL